MKLIAKSEQRSPEEFNLASAALILPDDDDDNFGLHISILSTGQVAGRRYPTANLYVTSYLVDQMKNCRPRNCETNDELDRKGQASQRKEV